MFLPRLKRRIIQRLFSKIITFLFIAADYVCALTYACAALLPASVY